jgi:hypothetical protein
MELCDTVPTHTLRQEYVRFALPAAHHTLILLGFDGAPILHLVLFFNCFDQTVSRKHISLLISGFDVNLVVRIFFFESLECGC